MSTKTAEWQSSNDDEHDYGDRSLDPARFERAVTGTMTAERVADRFYHVRNGGGETYDVDLESGGCTCPDWQYRGAAYACKHAIRAALIDVYQGRKARSAFAARVIAFTSELGCATDTRGCNGPFLAGDDGLLPCTTCCETVRSDGVDEFDVWEVTR